MNSKLSNRKIVLALVVITTFFTVTKSITVVAEKARTSE